MASRQLFVAGLLRALVLALASGWVAVLGACAWQAPPPSPPDPALLQDALFDHPPRPAGASADEVFRVDAAMRAYLRERLSGPARLKGRPRALADALYATGELRLDYDARLTRNAAEAFAARSGNCLSLLIMTAAMAREWGLTVTFQSARQEQAYSQLGGLTLRSGHVNLLLGPRPPVGSVRSAFPGGDSDQLQIDFLPPDALQGLRTRPISEATVLAMYMNNRAAESLLQGQPALAYAWAREALRQDPGFWAGHNTLGVVYQRSGHPAAAVRVFEQLLAHDGGNVAAMSNLALALQSLGRQQEARQWEARRAALESQPPFQWLRLGQAALARAAYAEALDLFQREQAVTGLTAEQQFGLARAWFGLGDRARAQQALQQARLLSPGEDQQARYRGKLAWLQALPPQ